MSLEGMTKVKKALIGNIHLLKKVSGYSAYDLAVADGFKGTLKEWLASLKGDPGYTPQKGTDYNDGEKGDPGTLENHSGIDALNLPIINVADPTKDTDAVNRKYVDESIAFKDVTESYISEVLDGVTVVAKKIYKRGNVICGDISVQTTLSDNMTGLFKINPDYFPAGYPVFRVGIIADGELTLSHFTDGYIYHIANAGSFAVMPCGCNGIALVTFSFTYPC